MRRPAALAAAALTLAWLAVAPARAALTAGELGRAGVRPPPGAALPFDLPVRDEAGRATTPRALAAGRPVVFVFADYACATLCGPALSITGDRLAQGGLAPGRDYRLLVLGLDPATAAPAASAFADARLPPAVRAAAAALTADAASIQRATAALGYGYSWDAGDRAFAHPVAAFVLDPGGRLSRTLSEVALTAPGLRAAVLDAKAGRTGGVVETVALVCHRMLVAAGRFDGAVIGLLRAGGAATVAALALGLGLLARRRRAAG